MQNRSQRLILQRGKGLGSFLGAIGRIFFPMIKKAIPAVTKIAKSSFVKKNLKKIGKRAAKSSVNVVGDLLTGKSPKLAINSEIQRIKKKIIKKISSEGPKKTKKVKRKKISRVIKSNFSKSKRRRKSILE